jgi:response regulator RpfG family c-di-GMP phosphodiesterase
MGKAGAEMPKSSRLFPGKENRMRVIVLMIEIEQPEGLSARKLVLETAKHNVITAYNGKMGIQLLKRFSDVDAVVVHVDVQDLPFSEVVRQVREIQPNIPIIALSPIGSIALEGVNYVIPSHEPQAILKVLADHFNASTSN